MYRFFSLSILQKKEANKEIITAIPNVDTLPGSSFPGILYISEILYNFCYLFNNLFLHKPFKNKDLYDIMVDTLKHLQVHAIPYKYCYLNASKCEYIVIFLTIYLKGRGYFLLAIKQLLLLPRGGTYKLWNFYMPRSNPPLYIP